LRKRFRVSTRHIKGKGLVISIQTIGGHTLFACTVGDLGGVSGIGDVSLDSWACLEGMINVVRRTGHSSFYVEKGMSAMGKSTKQVGTQSDSLRVNGGGEHNLSFVGSSLTRSLSLSNLVGGMSITESITELNGIQISELLNLECAVLPNCSCRLLFRILARGP